MQIKIKSIIAIACMCALVMGCFTAIAAAPNGNNGNNSNGGGNGNSGSSTTVEQTIFLKGSGSNFNENGWQNIFDVADYIEDVEYEAGSTPNVWHIVYSGKNFGAITGMQITFTNGEVFKWTPDMGASVNGGNNNMGWVIIAPYDWEIAYVNKGNNNDSDSFLKTKEEGNVNFNISGFSKGAPASKIGTFAIQKMVETIDGYIKGVGFDFAAYTTIDEATGEPVGIPIATATTGENGIAIFENDAIVIGEVYYVFEAMDITQKKIYRLAPLEDGNAYHTVTAVEELLFFRGQLPTFFNELLKIEATIAVRWNEGNGNGNGDGINEITIEGISMKNNEHYMTPENFDDAIAGTPTNGKAEIYTVIDRTVTGQAQSYEKNYEVKVAFYREGAWKVFAGTITVDNPGGNDNLDVELERISLFPIL